MTKRRTRSETATPVSLPYCKACNVEDFDHPALLPVLIDLYPGLPEYVKDIVDSDTGDYVVTDEQAIPPPHRRRKQWEVAMAVRALRDHGAVRPDARLLGVGAGREWTGFYLSREVEQVYMTDLYADTKKPWKAASPDMLVTPAPDTHGVWNARRLVVQHMDARALRYPDEFFDGIFSSSAIEHFGTADDMAAAIAEMVRVLKPGGVLTLATELLIETESDAQGQGWEGVYLFTPETLDRLIVQPSGCALVGEVDLAVSPDTRATQMTLATATVEASQFTRPHIVFAHHGFIFTSVFLALVKPE